MPSFAIHAICGNEILKEMNLSENAKKSFIIANIIPDVSRVTGFKKKDAKEKRKSIQDNKTSTHFRTDHNAILLYPDLDMFLEKYSGNVKSSITSFAYFFHLYTDYYFFRKFLTSVLSFYDEDMQKTKNKNDVKFVKVNRTGEIIEYSKVVSKDNDYSIYRDYSILNNYLLNKYELKIDYDDLFEYIDQGKFHIDIEETKSIYAYYAVFKMKKYLQDEKVKNSDLRIIAPEELDKFIKDVVKSFKKNYGYFINSYLK